MPRKTRIYYPGAIYHVMLRGNAGDKIFFNDDDRHYFCALTKEVVHRYGCRIHAFCLMSNHVHFAIQVGSVPLSQIIQNLAFRYARMINTRMKRIGHLFQGRYKAILVDSDIYIRELIRYIHLNPVRAKMVTNAVDYIWSSHRAYLGMTSISWLTTDWLLSIFSEKRSSATIKYHLFMQEDTNDSMYKIFHTGNQKGYDILGDDTFVNKFSSVQIFDVSNISFDNLLNAISKHYMIDLSELQSRSQKHRNSRIRAIAACLAKEMKIATLTKVAAYFRRDLSTLIRAISLLEEKQDFREELGILIKYFKDSRTQA